MNACCINICPADMQKNGHRCDDLVDMTASTLVGDAVALMLAAVQREDLELSIKQAIRS